MTRTYKSVSAIVQDRMKFPPTPILPPDGSTGVATLTKMDTGKKKNNVGEVLKKRFASKASAQFGK